MSSSTDAAALTATATESRSGDLDGDSSFTFFIDDDLVQAALAEYRRANPIFSTGSGCLHFSDQQEFRKKITTVLTGRVFHNIELTATGKRYPGGSSIFLIKGSIGMPGITHPASWHEGPCCSITDPDSKAISSCLVTKKSVPMRVRATFGAVHLHPTGPAQSDLPNSSIKGTLHLLHATEEPYSGPQPLWNATESGTYDSKISKIKPTPADQPDLWATDCKDAERVQFWFGRSTDSSAKTESCTGGVNVRLSLFFLDSPNTPASTSSVQAGSDEAGVQIAEAPVQDQPVQDEGTVSDH